MELDMIIKEIYIDMDGVLADFENGVSLNNIEFFTTEFIYDKFDVSDVFLFS